DHRFVRREGCSPAILYFRVADKSLAFSHRDVEPVRIHAQPVDARPDQIDGALRSVHRDPRIDRRLHDYGSAIESQLLSRAIVELENDLRITSHSQIDARREKQLDASACAASQSVVHLYLIANNQLLPIRVFGFEKPGPASLLVSGIKFALDQVYDTRLCRHEVLLLLAGR